MAIDFNATTSKLVNTTAAIGITTLITICAKVFPDSQGEGSFGRILALDEADNRLGLMHQNAANSMLFHAIWGTEGQWTFPITDGQWNNIALSYNAGSTANDPIARVELASVTVTEIVAPTGTWTAPLAGYCVGNRNAADRTWDGMIEHFQVFDVILTSQEMDDANRCPGSVTRGQKLWLKMPDISDVTDYSGNGFDGVATALTDRSPNSPNLCGSGAMISSYRNRLVAA